VVALNICTRQKLWLVDMQPLSLEMSGDFAAFAGSLKPMCRAIGVWMEKDHRPSLRFLRLYFPFLLYTK
jgi:hypothetical protein